MTTSHKAKELHVPKKNMIVNREREQLVQNAEIRMATFVAECNLSFNIIGTFTDGLGYPHLCRFMQSLLALPCSNADAL